MASRNSKMGVTVTAQDAASADLKRVAKAFSDTANAAAEANESTEAPSSRSAEALGRMEAAARAAAGEVGGSVAPTGALGAAASKLGPAASAAALGITAVTAATIGIGVAATVASIEVARLTTETARETAALNAQAAAAAASIEILTALGFAAQQLGSTTDDVQDALGELGQRALNIPKDFERWGIATRNTNGTLKTTEELLFAVSDRIQQTTSETERLALADELMSDVGRRLLPVLEQGSAGLREYMAEARATGAVIDETSAALATRFVRQLGRSETALAAVRREAGTAFQPALTTALAAVENVAGDLLSRIGDNQEAFESFATRTVSLVARGFATIVEAGSAASHVLEGFLNIFTFRFDPAFESARGLAGDLADEARTLARELDTGAAVTRDEVVPAVKNETAARAQLVSVLDEEKKKRATTRTAARDAIADLTELDNVQQKLSGTQDDTAVAARDALVAQLEQINTLKAQIRGVTTDQVAMARAIVEANEDADLGRSLGLSEEEVQAQRTAQLAAAQERIEGEAETARQVLQTRLAATRQALQATVEAAQEHVAVTREEHDRRRAEIAATLQAEADASIARLAIERQNAQAVGQLQEEARQARVQARDQEEREQIASTQRVAGAISGPLNASVNSVIAGTQSAGAALGSLFRGVAQNALSIAVNLGAQKAAALALTGTLAASKATDAATTKGAATSAVTASAARAGAAAYAAYAWIPIAGPALGAAAAAKAVATTLGFMSLLAFNKGGMVPGVGHTDSVPAMLTPGEIVLPAEVSQALMGAGAMHQGPPKLEIHNHNSVPTSAVEYEIALRRSLMPALERLGVRVR